MDKLCTDLQQLYFANGLKRRTKKALTVGEISEIIAQKSKGRLYKVPSTLRDALEYRLKREGLVEDENIANRSSIHKIPKVSRYSITPKGQKLLQGWIGFLYAFQ